MRLKITRGVDPHSLVVEAALDDEDLTRAFDGASNEDKLVFYEVFSPGAEELAEGDQGDRLRIVAKVFDLALNREAHRVEVAEEPAILKETR